jgi:hypothetical protein
MTVSRQEARSHAHPLAGGKSRPARELVSDAFFGPLANRLALAVLPFRVSPSALVLAVVSSAALLPVLQVRRERRSANALRAM